MSNKDISVGAVGLNDTGLVVANSLNRGSVILNKPCYLLDLVKPNGKFITIDKPEALNGFVQVKGIFCNFAEDEIIKNFSSILTSTEKELYIEVWIPWHRINFVRSLVFKQK